MEKVKKKAKKIKIVEVVELEIDIEDNRKLMPKRTIKEFWTLDKKYIGKIDPLDDYLVIEGVIKETASKTANSE